MELLHFSNESSWIRSTEKKCGIKRLSDCCRASSIDHKPFSSRFHPKFSRLGFRLVRTIHHQGFSFHLAAAPLKEILIWKLVKNCEESSFAFRLTWKGRGFSFSRWGSFLWIKRIPVFIILTKVCETVRPGKKRNERKRWTWCSLDNCHSPWRKMTFHASLHKSII